MKLLAFLNLLSFFLLFQNALCVSSDLEVLESSNIQSYDINPYEYNEDYLIQKLDSEYNKEHEEEVTLRASVDGYIHAFGSHGTSEKWKINIGKPLFSSQYNKNIFLEKMSIFPGLKSWELYYVNHKNSKVKKLDLNVKELIEQSAFSLEDFPQYFFTGSRVTHVFIVDLDKGLIVSRYGDDETPPDQNKETSSNLITIIRVDYMLKCFTVSGESVWNSTYSEILLNQHNHSHLKANTNQMLIDEHEEDEHEEKRLEIYGDNEKERGKKESHNLSRLENVVNVYKVKKGVPMKIYDFYDTNNQTFENYIENYMTPAIDNRNGLSTIYKDFIDWKNNQFNYDYKKLEKELFIEYEKDENFWKITAIVLFTVLLVICTYIVSTRFYKLKKIKLHKKNNIEQKNEESNSMEKGLVRIDNYKGDYLGIPDIQYDDDQDNQENSIKLEEQDVDPIIYVDTENNMLTKIYVKEKIIDGKMDHDKVSQIKEFTATDNGIHVKTTEIIHNKIKKELALPDSNNEGIKKQRPNSMDSKDIFSKKTFKEDGNNTNEKKDTDNLTEKQESLFKNEEKQNNLRNFSDKNLVHVKKIHNETHEISQRPKKNSESKFSKIPFEEEKEVQNNKTEIELNQDTSHISSQFSKTYSYIHSNYSIKNQNSRFNLVADITKSRNFDYINAIKESSEFSKEDNEYSIKGPFPRVLESNVSLLDTGRFKKDFNISNFLGEGGFGQVSKGRHKLDGSYYAIKMIEIEVDINQNLKELPVLKEVKTMLKLLHKNIVRYFNCWFESKDTQIKKLSQKSNKPKSKHSETIKTESIISSNVGIVFENKNEDTENQVVEVISSSESEKAKSISWEKASNTVEKKDYSYDLATSTLKTKKNYKEAMSVLFYIQMEYCGDSTLQQYLEKNSPLEKRTIFLLFKQIVDGVYHIHRNKIIHRDLKPANIFMIGSEKSRPLLKIGDFGLATDFKDSLKKGISENVGTPLYQSPEQAKNLFYDEKVDIYAMGLILLEMCAGFKTYHERKLYLEGMREENKKLPERILKEFPIEEKLIIRMTHSKASMRPKVQEILKSKEFHEMQRESEK